MASAPSPTMPGSTRSNGFGRNHTAARGVRPSPGAFDGSFESKPSNHDGQTAFTFELRFSEEFGIGYQTLRDHVFTVTGGTVEKAQRLEKPSNIGWRITVEPDSDGQVDITLPVTTDCAADGAICTEDGRKLSNRLELTVEAKEYNAPAGAPTISGTVEVGETLAADTSGISDADGLTGATFSYQWVSDDGTGDTDIHGETDSTYTLVPADEGKTFRVRVSFTDDAGYKTKAKVGCTFNWR